MPFLFHFQIKNKHSKLLETGKLHHPYPDETLLLQTRKTLFESSFNFGAGNWWGIEGRSVEGLFL